MCAKKPIMVRKSSLESNKKVVKKVEEKNVVNKSETIHYIIIGALFIFSIFLIYNTRTLNSKIDKLNKKLEDSRIKINILQRENNTLNKFYSENNRKVSFIDEKIVFVIKGFGDYYYTYDCMMKRVGNNQYSYWAYNIEQAKGKGYREGSC